MLRYTISAPELATGVCYRTLHLSAQASDKNRAEQLAAQIQAIPSNELQAEGIAVLFETPFIHPLTLTETFMLTEAFGNPNFQWGVCESDEIDMLEVHIFIPEAEKYTNFTIMPE